MAIKDRNYWKRKNIEDFITFVQTDLPEETELASFLKHQVDHFMGKTKREEALQEELFSDETDSVPVNAQEVVGRLFR